MILSSTFLRLSSIALLWASGNCQNNVTGESDGNATDECLVCGEGMIIGQAALIVSTDFGMFTCGGLAGAGLLGNIPDCAAAQEAAQFICSCMPDGSFVPPAIGVQPSPAPVTPAPTRFECSVCSDEKAVTLQNGIVTIEGQENKTCSEYMQLAATGLISEPQCGLLQQYTAEACGCSADAAPTPIIDRDGPTAAPAPYICPVCGTGMTVGSPDELVTVPTQEDRTCRDIEMAGLTGSINPEACNFLTPYVRTSCSCHHGEAPAVPEPTPAPVDTYVCNICGDGMVATNLEGVAFVPSQPSRTCLQYIEAAEAGNITESQCGLLQGFVFAPCGCESPAQDTSEPSEIPSDMPSMSPTHNTNPTPSPAPTPYVTARPGCYTDLKEIYSYESALRDSSLNRKYVLCPGTTFEMGVVGEGDKIESGQPFLMLRPNVVYQCGEDGSRHNNCVLNGGDFGVASYYGVYEGLYETVQNVKIKGLTFQSQGLFAAVLEAAGDISFVDCSFRMHANKVPVLIQWRGESPDEAKSAEEGRRLRKSVGPSPATKFYQRMRSLPEQTSITGAEDAVNTPRKLQEDLKHVVTFQDCIFANNNIIDKMGFPGVIENTFGSEVNIINCLFQNNVYGSDDNAAPFGYAIRSHGPLNIENSCFIDNEFLNYGPVLVYGAAYSSVGNYVESSQDDLDCGFLALFPSQEDIANDSPTCVNHEETTCGFTSSPTPSPSTSANDETPEAPSDESDGSGMGRATISLSVILVGLLSVLSSLC